MKTINKSLWKTALFANDCTLGCKYAKIRGFCILLINSMFEKQSFTIAYFCAKIERDKYLVASRYPMNLVMIDDETPLDLCRIESLLAKFPPEARLFRQYMQGKEVSCRSISPFVERCFCLEYFLQPIAGFQWTVYILALYWSLNFGNNPRILPNSSFGFTV